MAPLPPIFSAIARVAMVAAPIVGRAVLDAYKQAMINARHNAAVKASVMSAKMSRDEAFKILNLEEKNADLDAIQERAKGLFENNDPAKGGSEYLRQKISIAERIILEKVTPAEAVKEGAGDKP
mmetsp:Transcript_57712/g.84594  ORF Transcript_57712/g.84594 Transcript_57712/m.84594 type:complete len:124 (-) Transcript_57712:173-544(-)|eukprot:CAMPEP_0179433576 /NCGR_PEP_ID=MMETSP0799-20121207/17970_1 /TAXON_ID=46947 /ORGANISM="Geminigera cryophila, Strain CCMP2564" /LENGTH=123 /DNA_ID=CAMNT_0021211653 /DNA_START=208 /DNA_END=579 /DNA_ORIENTATION=-